VEKAAVGADISPRISGFMYQLLLTNTRLFLSALFDSTVLNFLVVRLQLL